MTRYYCDQCDKPADWSELTLLKIGNGGSRLYTASVCAECAQKVKDYIFSDAFKSTRPSLFERLWRAL